MVRATTMQPICGQRVRPDRHLQPLLQIERSGDVVHMVVGQEDGHDPVAFLLEPSDYGEEAVIFALLR
jgi:hypothetical protein